MRVVLPHVLSLRANVDRGVLAVLFNSLQHVQKADSMRRLHQRTVRRYIFGVNLADEFILSGVSLSEKGGGVSLKVLHKDRLA